MQKEETGSSLIHKFNNALDEDVCKELYNLLTVMKKYNSFYLEKNVMPWHQNDTLPYNEITDSILKKKISQYRMNVSKLIEEIIEETVYPNFTDIVLWRPGRFMNEHKDDGYQGPNEDQFICRHITSVTYCNDDYVGGETFIKNEYDGYYDCTPKTGSLVFFPSDDRCTHGVRTVLENNRVTLSTWYTKDINYFDNN